MIVSRRPRNPALAPFVESLWLFRAELAHGFERLLPNGRIQLLVNLFEDQLRDYASDGALAQTNSGAVVSGPRSHATVIDTLGQRSICGVSFLPGGARPFFKLPAAELCERTVDLSALWGQGGKALRERLLHATGPSEQLDVIEAALVEHATFGFAEDGAFATAQALLSEGVSVSAVEARLGLSPRALIDRFRIHAGLTPKRFARVQRFQRLVRAMDASISWSELALSHGYADQAHMIREFRAHAGSTPTAYRARSAGDRNHAPLELPEKIFNTRAAGDAIFTR